MSEQRAELNHAITGVANGKRHSCGLTSFRTPFLGSLCLTCFPTVIIIGKIGEKCTSGHLSPYYYIGEIYGIYGHHYNSFGSSHLFL